MLNIDKVKLKDIQEKYLDFINCDYLLCGGVVRYLVGLESDFRDIDLIVTNGFKMPKELKYTTNMYGGFKTNKNDKEIDIWELKNHVIPCDDFDEVQYTWLISYDAIFYRPLKDILYDKFFSKEPIKLNKDRLINNTEMNYLKMKIEKLYKKGLELDNDLYRMLMNDFLM